MSLKEKAREDGGRVRDREAQEGGMERIRERANTHVSVVCVYPRGKTKLYYVCKNIPSDISDSAATVAHTIARHKKNASFSLI